MEMCKPYWRKGSYIPECKVTNIVIHTSQTPLTVKQRSDTHMIPIPKNNTLDIEMWKVEKYEPVNEILFMGQDKICTFAIEILLEPECLNPFDAMPTVKAPSIIDIPKSIIMNRSSFIKYPLSQQEIKHKLKFLNCKFSFDFQKKPHAISITILD